MCVQTALSICSSKAAKGVHYLRPIKPAAQLIVVWRGSAVCAEADRKAERTFELESGGNSYFHKCCKTENNVSAAPPAFPSAKGQLTESVRALS